MLSATTPRISRNSSQQTNQYNQSVQSSVTIRSINTFNKIGQLLAFINKIHYTTPTCVHYIGEKDNYEFVQAFGKQIPVLEESSEDRQSLYQPIIG